MIFMAFIDTYTMEDYEEIVHMLDEIAEKREHRKRCPRATKHDTTAFFNFNHKRKKCKKG